MNVAGGDRGRLPSGPFLRVKHLGSGHSCPRRALNLDVPPPCPRHAVQGAGGGWHGRPHPQLYNELSARAESPIVPPRDLQVVGRLAVPGQGHVGTLCVPGARGGEESRASWKENQPPPLLPAPRPAPAPAAPFPCDPPRSFPGGGGAGRPGAPCARRGRGALTWRRLGARRLADGGRATGTAALWKRGWARPARAAFCSAWGGRVRATPTSGLCTLHHTGADVTAPALMSRRSPAARPPGPRRPGCALGTPGAPRRGGSSGSHVPGTSQGFPAA